MTKVNCIVPVRVRIAGCPDNLALDKLADSIASVVESRLRFARETLVFQRGVEGWPVLLHPPTVTFIPETIAAETQGGIQQAVLDAIDRATRGHSVSAPASPFLLADYKPGQGGSAQVKSAGPSAKPSGSTRPKAQLKIAAGQEAVFWKALRDAILSKDLSQPDRQTSAVQTLVMLVDQEEAHQILRAGLQLAVFESFVRLTILEELYAIAGDEEAIWDLILSGVGLKNDLVAEYKFFQWFQKRGGQATVDYLGKKLSGKDHELQIKAAKVVLYLLAREQEPEGAKLKDNFARLKKLAAKHNLWTGGPLGEESLRLLINGEIGVLTDLCTELALLIQASPYGDKFRDTDITILVNFQQVLQVKLGVVPGLDLNALENLDIRLAQATQAATEIISHTHILQENAATLIRFIGSGAGEADEVTALFQLRREYVAVLANALMDQNFVRSVHSVDLRYLNFDETVAALKSERIGQRYNEIASLFLQAKQIQPVVLDAGDQAYLDMAHLLEQYKQAAWLDSRDRTYIIVVRGEMKMNIWGLLVGMFVLYALALRMVNDLAKTDLDVDFRNKQTRRLNAIRSELLDYFKRSDFKAGSDRGPAIQKELQEIADAIQHEAKVEVGISLLITAVATLFSFGAAFIARLAMLGEMLALVRTADAASTVVLLVQVGTFTVAELAGEKLAFGKPITLSGAAKSFLSNYAMFGLFHVIGRFASRLARGNAFLRFIVPQIANFAAATTASALMTKLQTGQWPQDIGEFLLMNLASYTVIAALGAAAENLATAAIKPRVDKLVAALDAENAALFIRYKHAIETGTLTEPDFEWMRQRKLALHARARDLARYLNQQEHGLMSDEQLGAFEEELNAMDDAAKAAKFTASQPLLVSQDGGRLIRALPAPENTTGLVRLGTTNVYRYDPSHPPELSSMLARFEASGYRVQRYSGGLIRVLSGGGRTAFLLEPGPAVPSLLALPAGSPATGGVVKSVGLLEKVTGLLSTDDLGPIKAALKVINPGLVPTLEGEFEEPTSMATLGLLIEQRGNLTTRWPIDAVRGLAKMLQVERGITRATVRRLFLGRNSADLSALFEKFNRIADWSGANLLVDAELDPSRSVKLIDVYNAMGRVRPPDGMTRKAVRGLLNWVENAANAAEVVDKLRNIDPARRLSRLEADSPIKDPALRPPDHVEEVLRQHAEDVRPGVNLLHGKADEVMHAIDALAQRHGGGFTEPAVRAKFEAELQKYREFAVRFQAGEKMELNLVGARNELEGLIASLELGEQIFSLGPASIMVNPTQYPVPRARLVNWPTDIKVQLDAGARKVDGRLVITETTTAKIALPKDLKFLDPDSGLPPGDFVYDDARLKDDPDYRKWVQFVKMRASGLFSADLANALSKAWGHATAEVPELAFRGGTTADARRALIALGFTVAP